MRQCENCDGNDGGRRSSNESHKRKQRSRSNPELNANLHNGRKSLGRRTNAIARPNDDNAMKHFPNSPQMVWLMPPRYSHNNTFRESPESAIFEWIGFWTRPYERFLLYCSPTPGCRASSSSSSSYSIYIWKCNHDETRAHFSNKSQENLFMAVEKYTLLIWQCQTFEVHQFHLKIPSRTNRKWNECGSFALSCCHTHTINNHNHFFFIWNLSRFSHSPILLEDKKE